MAYLTFYNPYFQANRDEDANACMSRFNKVSGNCGCVPAANIYEDDASYLIEMALPGVSKESIRIKHENGLLLVNVEKGDENEEKYDRREFDYSGTSRVFKTGDKVNVDGIAAKYENGVLAITLPKKEAYTKKPAQEIAVN
jgi:HSP20 family protein